METKTGRSDKQSRTKRGKDSRLGSPGDTHIDRTTLAAPSYFTLLHNSRSFAAMVYRDIAVILFGRIEHHRLYETAGHKNMIEYAVAKLRLSTKSEQMRFSQAGAAVWANYPEECARFLVHATQLPTPVVLEIAKGLLRFLRSQLGWSSEHQIVAKLADRAFPLLELAALVTEHSSRRLLGALR